MKHLKNYLALLALGAITQACVVAPPLDGTYNGDISVDTDYVEPRVQYGSRSYVRIWLHPNYALPDAYDVALNHCRRYGRWAKPYRNWDYQTRSSRYVKYHCVNTRPTLRYPHIRRGSRPVVRHPRRDTVTPRRPVVDHRRGRDYGRDYRPPKRRTITPQRPERRREIGKPWEHNPHKDHDVRRPPHKEVGKPWEHNPRKDHPGRRNDGGRSWGQDRRDEVRPDPARGHGRSPSRDNNSPRSNSDGRRSTLAL